MTKRLRPQEMLKKILKDKSKSDGDGILKPKKLPLSQVHETAFDSRTDATKRLAHMEELESAYRDDPDGVDPIVTEMVGDGWKDSAGNPISNADYAILDGRTRRLAALNAGIKEIWAYVFTNLTDMERHSLALSLNMGGAEPATKEDRRMMVMDLFEKGHTFPEIQQEFSQFMSPYILEKAIHWCESDVRGRNTTEAKAYVRKLKHLTLEEAVEKAAERFSVPGVKIMPETLMNLICPPTDGRGRKLKAKDILTKQRVSGISGGVVKSFDKIEKVINDAVEDYSAAYRAKIIVRPSMVKESFKKWNGKLKNLQTLMATVEAKFDTKCRFAGEDMEETIPSTTEDASAKKTKSAGQGR